METSLNNRISTTQVFFVIVQTQIGISILTLPRDVYGAVEWEGWISIAIAGAVIQLVLLIYVPLVFRFKHHTFFTLTKITLGTPISVFINLGYFFYFISVSILILILYYRTIAAWLLPVTPKWMIMLLIISAAVYLVREDIHIIGRFYALVSGLLVIVIAVQFTGYTSANPLYLLPIGHVGIKDYIEGAQSSLQAMLGFEVLLFIYPFIQGAKKKVIQSVSLAIWFTVSLYIFTTVSVFLFFSPDEIELVPHPVLYMLKAYSSPFIDRLDLIFISIWIVSVTTSLIMYLYLVSLFTQVILPIKKRKTGVLFGGTLIFAISMFFESNESIDAFGEFVSKISYSFIFYIPAVLLIVALIRKKPERGKE
ncbi:hypothetical protein CR194_01265 [Salipaludibacillus keqinensis]|uniref:Uncharacterized protein n=1 Tax=Salipaludibacillus keqinensis TaxID=2045207 RepID=A0A323TJ23_9BACI|nr:GerAB/ArcD/ProY family transporter [Salipaludibacillus keqinensis]PYZ94196.1 hypothetical protein CR194_01265 [Salipaludibacillus keqinensis]